MYKMQKEKASTRASQGLPKTTESDMVMPEMPHRNSLSSVAQVVIEGMKEFEEEFWLHRIPHNTKQMNDVKYCINTLLIKVLEAIEKEVGGKKVESAKRLDTFKEGYKAGKNDTLSDIQQLLISTKEQIR